MLLNNRKPRIKDKYAKNNGRSEQIVKEMLQIAGITIGGNKPWDIEVHNEKLYDRLIYEGELGAGESYMDGWWDCPALDPFFDRLFRGKLQDHFKDNRKNRLHAMKARLLNLQTNKRQRS